MAMHEFGALTTGPPPPQFCRGKGWREGVGDKQGGEKKRTKNSPPEMCSLLGAGAWGSAAPKRSRSKRGWTQKNVNDCKRAQTSANASPQKSAKGHKRAQKGANERKRALPRKNRKQPGLI